MSSKGSIPIPYIIAIIFGIVVIALISYWFFTLSTSASESGTSAECTALKVTWCQECISNAGTGTTSDCADLVSITSEENLKTTCRVLSIPTDISTTQACSTFLGIFPAT
jgi:hypothetical protein